MKASIYGKKLGEARAKVQVNATLLGAAVDLEPEYLQALEVTHKDPQIVHLRTLEAVGVLLEELVARALPEEDPEEEPEEEPKKGKGKK